MLVFGERGTEVVLVQVHDARLHQQHVLVVEVVVGGGGGGGGGDGGVARPAVGLHVVAVVGDLEVEFAQ